jgi:hypothetical protein
MAEKGTAQKASGGSQRISGGFRPDLLQQYALPGSDVVMSSYEKIFGEEGYDPRAEIEAGARNTYSEWKKNNPGRGPADFKEYLTKMAAWEFHRGAGGRQYAEKMARSRGGGSAYVPKTIEEIQLVDTTGKRL